MYVCMCSRAHHKVTPDNTHHADPGLSLMTSNIPVSLPTPNKKQREGEREEREGERGKRENQHALQVIRTSFIPSFSYYTSLLPSFLFYQAQSIS